uniref:Uncharacterized protein n=1 Tax=Panagrolaimus davidi TaxID=227884 RepID=A0A914PXJ3_9BILA
MKLDNGSAENQKEALQVKLPSFELSIPVSIIKHSVSTFAKLFSSATFSFHVSLQMGHSEKSKSEDDDCIIIEHPTNQRKRPLNTTSHSEESNTRKKPKILNENENGFKTFEYEDPTNEFLKKCCKILGLKFDRNIYNEFSSKIKFTQISADLKPDEILQTNDKTGFAILSLFFTAKEENGALIKEKIYEKFIKDLVEFDKEKIQNVMLSKALTPEHFHTVSNWFNCRFLVFSNDGWEKYGNWNSDEAEEYIPVFVLEKKNVENEQIYQIILSLKNE